jgi:cytochrome c553
LRSSWNRRVFSFLCRSAAATLAVAAAVASATAQDKFAPCQSCHGASGVSATPGIPSLAGQPEAFIEYQLVFFRSGARKSDIMAPTAASLSDDEVRRFAAYYAALIPPRPLATPDENPDMTAVGAKLAEAQHCPACHLPDFAGTQATPRLAAQREEYLKQALLDFKTGKRIGGGVAAMPEIAFSLSEPQIAALAHFLARLPHKTKPERP